MSSESSWELRVEAQLAAIREEVKRSRHIAPAALSITEAAQMLSCSPDHITKMVKNGSLRPRDLDGLKRIPVSQIHELLDSPPNEQKPTITKAPRFDPEKFKADLRRIRKGR